MLTPSDIDDARKLLDVLNGWRFDPPSKSPVEGVLCVFASARGGQRVSETSQAVKLLESRRLLRKILAAFDGGGHDDC